MEKFSTVIPDGTLGESESAGDPLELGAGVDQVREFRRFGFHLELPRRGVLGMQRGCEANCYCETQSHIGEEIISSVALEQTVGPGRAQ